MALRFFDGFDHYNPNGEIVHKWTSQTNNINVGSGRFGGQSAALSDRGVSKVLDSQVSWVFGYAVQFGTPLVNNFETFQVSDIGGTCQIGIGFNTAGRLIVYRNVVGTVIATGTRTHTSAVWYYIEVKVTIANAGGTVIVRSDGVEDINFTGDTQQSANAHADRFSMHDSTNSPGAGTLFDDVYICDTSGSAPYNDFLGDVRAETILPSGNGNSSQWLGSDGNSTDNYLLVDDPSSPDDDTTYVGSLVVAEKDTYAYGNLASTSGDVYAVQILPWAKKADAGSRSIVTIARLAGTEVDSSAIAVPSSYTYITQDIRTTKPGGGSWSIADVNSAEFGIKVNT